MLLRILAGSLVLLLTGCGFETIVLPRWWSPWRVETEHETTYYRLKVALSHKGQPIDLDVVVGCGVRSQHYSYGETSVEIGGMYPLVYAVAIPGGHAVKVRTLPVVDGYSLCQGGTSDNGAVPREWIPFITWYDDARDLSHGIGYATPDAYANPRSQLEYHGAHVSAATRADFDAFLKTKPVNLVPAYLAGWLFPPGHVIRSRKDVTPAMKRDPRTAWKLEGKPNCRGVLRIKLDDRQRRLVRSLWPAQRPRIWSLADWKAQHALQDELWPPNTWSRPYLQSWITPERIALPKRGPPPAVYPTSIDYGLSGWARIPARVEFTTTTATSATA